MRTFIIADIHGCNRELSELLSFLNPDPETDRMILLGDLFDRGPDSWEVYQTVLLLASAFGDRFILLRGNHEDYLLTDKLTFRQKWMWNRVGRPATVRSFKAHGGKMEDTVSWLRETSKLYYRDENIQCAHAGVAVEPIEMNSEWTLMHDHRIVLENSYAGSLTITGHIALEVPTWFSGDGETVEMVPWGEDLMLPESGVLCIDTGCGKGGPLTALVMDGKTGRLERTLI